MMVSSYDGTEMEQAIAVFEEALVKLKAEAIKVQEQLNSVIPKRQEVEPCNCMGEGMSVDSYRDHGRHSLDRWLPKVKRAQLHADDLLDRSRAIHEENAPAIESNKEAAEEREEKAKLAKLKEDRALAVLIGRYGSNITASANEVLDRVVNCNKYLRLAHYMLANRNDWNDGYSSAQYGLQNFSIRTKQDMAIYDDVSSYIGEDWDGDGCVFRDCEWNYTRIFDLVEDEELMEDYRTVSTMVMEV